MRAKKLKNDIWSDLRKPSLPENTCPACGHAYAEDSFRCDCGLILIE